MFAPIGFTNETAGSVPAWRGGHEVGLVLQVRRLGGGAVGVLGEVGERLMMKLEQRIRMAGECVVPSAGVPGPRHRGVAQSRSPIVGMRLIRHELVRRRPSTDAAALTVYDVLTAKPSGVTKPSVTRLPLASSVATTLAGAFGKHRRRGGDEEDVIEERAAERAVKEVIGQRVLRRFGRERERRRVVVAHAQALRVAHLRELVHLAAVDLLLLLVVAMHEVARRDRRRHVLVDVERRVRQRGRDRRAVHLRQRRVRGARRAHLLRGAPRPSARPSAPANSPYRLSKL